MAGKTGLITGAAGVLGEASARALLSDGYRLALVDRDEGALARVKAALAAEAPADSILCLAEDCTCLAGMERAVAACVAAFGGLDALVLNAGIEGPVAMIEDIDPEAFDAVMAVNVRGPLVGLKAGWPALRAAGGGAAVILSSVAGAIGTPALAAYTTSKHAVVGLMRCAAIEGAPHNIRVNTVHPGPVESRMMRSLEAGFAPDAPGAAQAAQLGLIPLGRYALPGDIAAMIAFLLSDKAAYCSGQTYHVDGAMLAGKAQL